MEKLPSDLAKMFSSYHTKHVPEGQILYYEGDAPEYASYVKNGVVKVYSIDQSGNEKILHLLGAPALIPFTILEPEEVPTQWFYNTLTDCEITSVPRQELRKILLDNGKLTAQVLQWYVSQIHELLVRLDSLGKTRAQDKLKAALTFLAVYHSKLQGNGWRQISFPVSHQLIADIISMTRESTARAMKRLNDKNVVRSPKLTVLEVNWGALKKL